MQFFHSLLCVLIQFLILRLMGRTITAVFTSFFFQMVKLLLHQYAEGSPLFTFALPSSNWGWKSGDRSKPAGRISLNNPNWFFPDIPYGWILLHSHRAVWHQVDNATLRLDAQVDWWVTPPSYLLHSVSRASGKRGPLLQLNQPISGLQIIFSHL